MSIMEQTLRETVADYEIRIPMSYQDYQQKFDEDVHVEWVQGEAIIFMSAATRHQIIVMYLSKLLGIYIEFFRLGELLSAPFEMKISSESNAREPDILFVAADNRRYLEEQRLAGAADLVIEVVSPESVKRDNEDKFAEYEAAGIRASLDHRSPSRTATRRIFGLGRQPALRGDACPQSHLSLDGALLASGSIRNGCGIRNAMARWPPLPKSLACRRR